MANCFLKAVEDAGRRSGSLMYASISSNAVSDGDVSMVMYLGCYLSVFWFGKYPTNLSESLSNEFQKILRSVFQVEHSIIFSKFPKRLSFI